MIAHGRERHEGRDDDARAEDDPAARGLDGARHDDRRLQRDRPALAAPGAEGLVGVQPEVDGVVAQEPPGVDAARQLLLVAALHRREVLAADLGLALGAQEVHALRLARRGQAVGQALPGRRGPWLLRRALRPAAAGPSRPSGRAWSRAVTGRPRRRRPAPGRARPRRRRVGGPAARSSRRTPDVPALLELVDDPGRPGVPDLEPALEQRRRGAIVLLDDGDGIRQEPVGVLVGAGRPRCPVDSSSSSTIERS